MKMTSFCMVKISIEFKTRVIIDTEWLESLAFDINFLRIFDNKSEISEGERSSPGILMKQKIWVQNLELLDV